MERSFDHSPRRSKSSHPKVATTVGDRETVFGPFKYVNSDGLVSTTFAALPAQYIENAEIHVEQIDGETGSIEVVVNGELAIPGSSLGTTVHEATVPIVLDSANTIELQTPAPSGKGVLVEITAIKIAISDVLLEPSALYVGETQDVLITARVEPEGAAGEQSVTLQELQANGAYVEIGTLHDSGQANGDGFAGDGVYGLVRSFHSEVPVDRVLRIKSAAGSTERYSADVTLEIFNPITDQELDDMTAVGDAALDAYSSQASVLGHEAAADFARAHVELDPAVVGTTISPTKDLLIITFSTGRGYSVLFRNTEWEPSAKRKGPRETATRTSDSGVNGGELANSIAPSNPTIGTRDILLLSPFEFQLGTIYDAIYPVINEYNSTHCDGFRIDYVENDFVTVRAMRDVFSTNSHRWGMIVWQSHADSDLIDTGQQFVPGVPVTDKQLKADIDKHRVYPGAFYTNEATLEKGHVYGIRPAFLHYYMGKKKLPNTIVMLAACNSLRSDRSELADAFIAIGANSVLGYTNLSNAPFHAFTIAPYISRLINVPALNADGAFIPNILRPDWLSCRFEYKKGARRAATIPTPRCPTSKVALSGDVCPDGVLANASFETGTLEGWFHVQRPQSELGARVVSHYGAIVPPGDPEANRSFAIMEPTGGFLYGGPAIAQSLECVAGKRIVSIAFDYNFIAPDLPTYCDGRDLPFIETRVIGAGLQGYVDLRTWLALECGTEMAIPSVGCGDYVVAGGSCGALFQTGWKRASYPMFSGVLGEDITFAMNVDGDYGDVTYPFRSTALIDNVVVELMDDSGVRSTVSIKNDRRAVATVGSGTSASSSFFGSGFVFADEGPASVYASEIVVESIGGGGGDRGVNHAVSSVTVTIEDLQHSFPDDVDLLLQAPSGQAVLLMSDVGGGGDISGVTLTFDDDAPGPLPDDERIVSGSFTPTNNVELFPDVFPAPAPQGPYGASLAELAGINPIGTWKLWAVDNARGDRGVLLNGWQLSIETLNQAPVAICQDVTVEADETCTGSVSIDDGSFDPDGSSSGLSFEQSPAGPYPLGTTVVTLTVTDQDGDSSVCSANVIVVDSVVPTVSCPLGSSSSVASGCLAPVPSVLSASSATDNCTSTEALVFSQVPTAGTMVGPGVHTITVSATDAASNTGTCTTTFTVVDAQPPTITGPVPAIYLRTSTSAGGAMITFPSPSASDNCGTVNVTAIPSSGTTFPNGKTLVTATAVDAAGLSASTQFTVKVVRFGESIGIYIPSTAGWFLRNTNSNGDADLTFSFGPGGDGWVPIAGDWDRSGTDTPGLFYNPTAGVFLSDTSGPGGANYVFTYGPSGANWIPLAGDWNGEGVDSIGLYDPTTGNFFLKNINAAGNADVILQLGPGNVGFLPIVGDWNGDGIDTVGIYNPETGVFFLRNSNTNGPADVTFTFGAGGKGYLPMSGDWNGDNICTIGLYDPSTGAFLLRNSNDDGPADLEFLYGPDNQGAVPVAGSWDGQ